MSETEEKVVASSNIPRGARSKGFFLEDVSGSMESQINYPLQVLIIYKSLIKNYV
jgi:hypothetical protein